MSSVGSQRQLNDDICVRALSCLDPSASTVMGASEEQNVTSSDGYTLGRNYLASGRLVLQHFLWKNAIGSLLHPEIVQSLQASRLKTGNSTLRVADVGTGTGIWLFDLASWPSLDGFDLHCHGFDISDGQFPLAQRSPPNTQFSVSDAFVDPPAELWGQFDVVHVRLFIAVLSKTGDPAPVLAHLYKLLKPGGWLQWDEVDSANHYGIYKLNPDGVSRAHDELVSMLGGTTREWPQRLAEHMAQAGLVESKQEVHEARSEWLEPWSWNELMVFDELANKRDDGERIRRAVHGAYAESRDASVGAVIKTSPTVTIGKKPT